MIFEATKPESGLITKERYKKKMCGRKEQPWLHIQWFPTWVEFMDFELNLCFLCEISFHNLTSPGLDYYSNEKFSGNTMRGPDKTLFFFVRGNKPKRLEITGLTYDIAFFFFFYLLYVFLCNLKVQALRITKTQ